MTTQEMLAIVLNNLAKNRRSKIVGGPREVPHGGMAVDVRQYTGNFFQAVCFQVYGKTEVLLDAEEILGDSNMDSKADSKFWAAINSVSDGKMLSGVASVKMFPKDAECVKHLLKLEERILRMDYYSNFVLLTKKGYCEILIANHNHKDTCH